jgi:hypothetical protein
MLIDKVIILVIDADWLYQTYPYRSVSHNMKTISAKYLLLAILYQGYGVFSISKGYRHGKCKT